MKKVLSLIFVLSLMITSALRVNSMTFEEGYNQCRTKPVVVLIYADWAENYQAYIQNFRAIQSEFENVYNFVELDVASPDAKFFNSLYHIYPNLPYVLLYRDGGKISRYIPRNCASDTSCMRSKLKSFIL